MTAATTTGPEEAYANTSWNTPTVKVGSYLETFVPSPYSVTYETLSAEASRSVQLGWQSTWQHNN